MKSLNKLQVLMLLSLLLGLQDLDAQKRIRDAQAAASSSAAMFDEGDDVTDGQDPRATVRARRYETDEGIVGDSAAAKDGSDDDILEFYEELFNGYGAVNDAAPRGEGVASSQDEEESDDELIKCDICKREVRAKNVRIHQSRHKKSGAAQWYASKKESNLEALKKSKTEEKRDATGTGNVVHGGAGDVLVSAAGAVAPLPSSSTDRVSKQVTSKVRVKDNFFSSEKNYRSKEHCASFLDRTSRAALWSTNNVLNRVHNEMIYSLKFDPETPYEMILAKVKRCPNLESLDISFCKNLTPAMVCNLVEQCSKLNKLILCNCEGSAGFIDRVSDKVVLQLEELDLRGTKATAAQVREIVQRCPRSKLTMLKLRGCRGAAGFIEGLPAGVVLQLEELDLGYTDATAAQVRAIVQRCPQLKKLNLEGCGNSAGFIEGLPVDCAQHLEELVLRETGATVVWVRAIVQRFPKLKKLDLFRENGLARFIEGLPAGIELKLEELDLMWTYATAAQVRAIIQRCPNLKKLSIGGCPESARFIDDLLDGYGRQLQELDLRGTGVTATQVRAMMQRFPNLKKLNLAGCRAIVAFLEGLPEAAVFPLEELNLNYTNAKAAQVRAIVQHCPNLKKLKLFECRGSAGFIVGLPVDCGQQLEELILWKTDATAAQVRAIVRHCPTLKKLNLIECHGVAEFILGLSEGIELSLEALMLEGTDATANQVREVIRRCKKLKILDLIRCRKSEGFIVGLPAHCGQRLEKLCISWRSITEDQLEAVRARFPRCEVGFLKDRYQFGSDWL